MFPEIVVRETSAWGNGNGIICDLGLARETLRLIRAAF